MVITVSAIFALSWGGDAILHLVEDADPSKLSPLGIPIVHVTITFNAAVNPFAYALINERFRKKMKEMIRGAPRCFATKSLAIPILEPGNIPFKQQDQLSHMRFETNS